MCNHFFQRPDLFSRKFEVFNEMEMEVNAINYKIFTKLYLKIRVRGKEISYAIFQYQVNHMKEKLDYSKCEYSPDKNSNSNENMLFLRKTDETIWKPPSPFSKRTPPFN